eukprot:5458823-Pleurochrysis_carterae.AAC.6
MSLWMRRASRISSSASTNIFRSSSARSRSSCRARIPSKMTTCGASTSVSWSVERRLCEQKSYWGTATGAGSPP